MKKQKHVKFHWCLVLVASKELNNLLNLLILTLELILVPVYHGDTAQGPQQTLYWVVDACELQTIACMNCIASECVVCHPQVCTEGRLILEFTFDDLMRIKTWHFTIRQYRELVPRSILAMHVSNIISILSPSFLFPLHLTQQGNPVLSEQSPAIITQLVLSIESSSQPFECTSSYLPLLFPFVRGFYMLVGFPWWMVSIFFSCSSSIQDTFLPGCMNLLPVMRMWTKTGSESSFQFWLEPSYRKWGPYTLDLLALPNYDAWMEWGEQDATESDFMSLIYSWPWEIKSEQNNFRYHL